MKQVDRITLDVAIEAVQSITGIKNVAAQLSEQKIINVVADYYNLAPSQLIGKVDKLAQPCKAPQTQINTGN